MKPAKFSYTFQPDYSVNEFQNQVKNFSLPVENCDLIDGVLLENINLEIGANTVYHKLNRQPIGWIVCDSTGGSIINRTAWNEETISLNSFIATTVKLWIF